MTRFFCDFCDTYLTHDSIQVRKQHNAGYKHKANVRNYYMQFEEAQTQMMIDNKLNEYEQRARMGMPPGQMGPPAFGAPGPMAPGMGMPPGPRPPSMPPPGGMPPRPYGTPPMGGMPMHAGHPGGPGSYGPAPGAMGGMPPQGPPMGGPPMYAR